MKSRQWIAAVIVVSGIATVGSAVADSRSDGPVAGSTNGLMNAASRVYIYEWARPEWIGADTGASGVAGARYSGRTREEVRAELEQARADGLLMTHGEQDDLSVWDRARIGATGVTGSRYSGHTRAEVRAEAIEHAKKFKSGNDEMYGR